MNIGIKKAKEIIDSMYERINELRECSCEDELTQKVISILKKIQEDEYPELGIGVELRDDELFGDILVTWGIEGIVVLTLSERNIDDKDKIHFWVRMTGQGRYLKKNTKGYVATGV